MSELKTNKISTNDANNVAIDNSLGLKSYGTTARNALTSVAGDMIYNSDDAKVQVYNGSSWQDLGGAAIEVEYLIIGGAGAGGGGSLNWTVGGGGGAGGLRNSYASENTGGGLSGELALQCFTGVNYAVSVGGGGTGSATIYTAGGIGTRSYFAHITGYGGGGGGDYYGTAAALRNVGGSTGAEGSINSSAIGGRDVIPGQGYKAGDGRTYSGSQTTFAGGGGGGAAAVGSNAASGAGGAGGTGLTSSITGSSVVYAGGGGGAGYSSGGSATGGGGAGKNTDGGAGNNGTANFGGGGGGGTTAGNSGNTAGGNGGSGVVILRYPNTYTLSQSGLTTSNINTAIGGTSDKYTTITAGTGTVSFA